MNLIKPALVFVALTSAASCAKRMPTPLAAPETPAPVVDTSRRAALRLLRAELEIDATRRRVRLPADAHIRLAPKGASAYTFRCAYYEYVPAASWPWVYTAAGTVDLGARRVTLTALVAETSQGPVPTPAVSVEPGVDGAEGPARPVPGAEGLGM